jgi:serine/threonine protein kinase
MTAACIDDLDAWALVDGALDPARVAVLVEHADHCGSCRELIENLCAAQAPATTPTAPADPLIGTEVGEGAYRILDLLGTGGMGQVYRAAARDRDVAIKMPRTRSKWLVRRFEREVAITARLVHPGIVPVHAAGHLDDGRPYYVMPILDGEPLDAALARTANREQRLAFVDRLVAVADTMAFAHDAGIAHRDLKPQNIVLGGAGETLVIDWGLAKDLRGVRAVARSLAPPSVTPLAPSLAAAVHARAAGASVSAILSGRTTRPGDVLGTPAFMAPEQARGEDVDQRADVYALGAMLEQLLTGRLPRKAADAALAQAPQELVAICRKAMATSPGDRYPDGRAFAADLRVATRTRHAAPAQGSRRVTWPYVVLLAAGVLFGAGACILGWS